MAEDDLQRWRVLTFAILGRKAGADRVMPVQQDNSGQDGSNPRPGAKCDNHRLGDTLVDPRRGDVEDDSSSTKRRSLLAIAGSLLAEISLPKLLFAWTVSILLPGVLLGSVPLIGTAWLAQVSGKIAGLTEYGAVIVLVAVVGLGWIGWRPLFRIAEVNFWSLNALAVQPGYAFCREALRHLAEQMFGRHSNALERTHLRAAASVVAGIVLCGCAVLIVVLVWPSSRWVGTVTDLALLHRLIVPTFANAVVVVACYVAVASLVWGISDASMGQPLDLATFDAAPADGRTWRVAHLSDLHVVGERFGFRIESGRSGPRGNDRIERIMSRLEAIHSAQPLDLILVSGDMTDAGLSTEWAEFMEMAARCPDIAQRMLILPGNHDVNIVDRANPARLDLPFSPGKQLRQIRALSAITAVQGDRVYVAGESPALLNKTLTEKLHPYRERIVAFADQGGLRRSAGLRHLWDDLFPMVLPPDIADGLGVLVLNSNAETHFSFTNALGLISVDQTRRLMMAIDRFPRARWIIALHHHLIEYPMPVTAFSERVGTALINGSWFVRQLKSLAGRAVVMHGHRHIDWIGECEGVRIISAPSPVMGAKDQAPSYFHIHTLAAGSDGRLRLLPPERIDIAGADVRSASS
jgi:hypothetical protein